MNQRIQDARALRDELVKQGVDVAPLDRALQAMRAAAHDDAFDDMGNAAALRAQLIEGLRAYEFALRRATGEPVSGTVLLGRSGDVPAKFRSYVEEYYRSIVKPVKPVTP